MMFSRNECQKKPGSTEQMGRDVVRYRLLRREDVVSKGGVINPSLRIYSSSGAYPFSLKEATGQSANVESGIEFDKLFSRFRIPSPGYPESIDLTFSNHGWVMGRLVPSLVDRVRNGRDTFFERDGSLRREGLNYFLDWVACANRCLACVLAEYEVNFGIVSKFSIESESDFRVQFELEENDDSRVQGLVVNDEGWVDAGEEDFVTNSEVKACYIFGDASPEDLIRLTEFEFDVQHAFDKSRLRFRNVMREAPIFVA